MAEKISQGKHYVFVAEIKEKTREEILEEKTYRERNIAWNKINEMQEEYENAVSNKRWDKKRECYVNRNGEPVVPKKDIIFDDILLEIPRSVEYYTNVGKDKTYVKRFEKLLREVMTASLRKKDEERMKKNVDEMVNDLKKIAEEVKVENVKISEEEKVEEAEKKLESSVEVKDEILEVTCDVGVDAGDEKKSDVDQKQREANNEMPITEGSSDTPIIVLNQEKGKLLTSEEEKEKEAGYFTEAIKKMDLNEDSSVKLQNLVKKVIHKSASPNTSAVMTDIELEQRKRQELLEQEAAEDIAAANEIIQKAFNQMSAENSEVAKGQSIDHTENSKLSKA
ncbi:uncharacterized protein LOC110923653 [Helianthus annuus]|uniref:uncharacterized protein LOC110923653 n=1 Tax=Helianthus annuus TaxID=4232 RepID=UPI000B8F7967|nr:uncharacterized protein LOC110923653 [Helianthus annuus]